MDCFVPNDQGCQLWSIFLQVLSDLDQCYCVVLRCLLDAGAVPPAPPITKKNSASFPSLDSLANSQTGEGNRGPASDNRRTSVDLVDGRSSAIEGSPGPRAGSITEEWSISTRRKVLFAGYVSYTQIMDFMNANHQRSILNALLGAASASSITPNIDKVLMSGPGGIGRAEVAVTKKSWLSATGQTRGLNIFARAKQLASGIHRTVRDGPVEGQQQGTNASITCALMLLTLPVNALVLEILDNF